MPDKKITARYGCVVKTPYQVHLCGLVKIYHHIPAENQVKGPPETDGLHQVKGPEYDVLFDGRRDAVGAAAGFDKILLFPGFRHTAQAFLLIGGILGRVQYLLGYVGGQDPGIPA